MAAQAPQSSLSEDKYVALVSGLGLGDDAADPLKLSLLVDYLVGSLASNEEQTRVSKVSSQTRRACRARKSQLLLQVLPSHVHYHYMNLCFSKSVAGAH